MAGVNNEIDVRKSGRLARGTSAFSHLGEEDLSARLERIGYDPLRLTPALA